MNKVLSILFIVFVFSSCNEKTKNNLKTENKIDSNFDCYTGTQLEINLCSLKEFNYLDSALNKEYKFLLNLIDEKINIEKKYKNNYELIETEKFRNKIVSSQGKWIQLREINSETIGILYNNGSMKPYVVNSCLINDTKNRIKFIQKLIVEIED